MDKATLAERLGYRAEDRLLIVNCDDLGASHAANVGIFRAMTYGVATSATLMVPCPWAREAVTMCEGKPIGIHLTLTAEYSGYRWRGLTDGKSLHDTEGYFPYRQQPALQRLDPEDVKIECRAQIATALSWGVDVTHLDAHMGVIQYRSDLFDVYLDLAEEFRLPVRMYHPEKIQKLGFPARERADARGILCNDHMVYSWPRPTRDVYFEELPRIAPGVTEAFAHPVVDGEELRAYDTENADIRVHDMACMLDPTVAALMAEQNLKRISFRELRDLQRAGG